MRNIFPKVVSYNHFVEQKKEVAIQLTLFTFPRTANNDLRFETQEL